jgi:hypothetical protein
MELEMKQLINLFASLLLVFPLVAHAAWFGKDDWEKDDCPKEHSLAWCLADFQGRSKGLYDQTPEQFSKEMQKAGVNDPNQISELIMHNGLGVGVSIGNFMMGNMLGGGIFMLSAIMPGEGEQNRTVGYIIFIEKSNGLNDKLMSDQYNSILKKAIEDSVPELCNQEKCEILYGTSAYSMSEKIREVPMYLNNSSVAAFKLGISDGIVLNMVKDGTKIKYVQSLLPAQVFAISKKLPSNYYWFIPAGHLGGNPVPMFLNQGKALFFVKPDPKNPAPVLPHLHS